MSPKIAKQTVKDMYSIRLPILFEGPPGGGKSDTVKQASDEMFAAEYGYTVAPDGSVKDAKGNITPIRPWLIDVRAVLFDPVDLRGLPYVVDGETRQSIPSFLPKSGKGIIFIDEIAQAAPLVQSAFLQLILDRKLGDYVMPDGWCAMAACNRVEDGTGSHRLINSLGARFDRLDFEVSADDWQEWAAEAGIRPDVRSYVKSFPQDLHKFDRAAKASPNPRAWAFVSRIMGIANDLNMFDLVKGVVGDGVAAKFIAHAKMYRAMPDIDAILDEPLKATVPTQADVLWSVAMGIVDRCRDIKAGRSDAAVTYASRMPKEFGVFLFRDLVKIDRTILLKESGKAFLKANRDSLISAA